MLKFFRKQMNKKGFTLIELIVVIAILAILAAIAVPRFLGTLDNARSTANDAVEKVVESAVQTYYAENGSYPADLAALDPDYLDTADLEWADGTPITEIAVAADGTITFTPVKP